MAPGGFFMLGVFIWVALGWSTEKKKA
jgi:Na+-transporting NADH:ubiquinone oxidoreductase subunit NqrD